MGPVCCYVTEQCNLNLQLKHVHKCAVESHLKKNCTVIQNSTVPSLTIQMFNSLIPFNTQSLLSDMHPGSYSNGSLAQDGRQ